MASGTPVVGAAAAGVKDVFTDVRSAHAFVLRHAVQLLLACLHHICGPHV